MVAGINAGGIAFEGGLYAQNCRQRAACDYQTPASEPSLK